MSINNLINNKECSLCNSIVSRMGHFCNENNVCQPLSTDKECKCICMGCKSDSHCLLCIETDGKCCVADKPQEDWSKEFEETFKENVKYQTYGSYVNLPALKSFINSLLLSKEREVAQEFIEDFQCGIRFALHEDESIASVEVLEKWLEAISSKYKVKEEK